MADSTGNRPFQAVWGSTLTAESLRGALLPSGSALPVPTAEDRSLWDPSSGSVHAATAGDLLSRAEAEQGDEWPHVPARGYLRYVRDGDRVEHEGRIKARQQRLSRATVAAALTLDPCWIDAVADGVLLLCEQTSWCWPAHDDIFARRGHLLPAVDEPFLDLGAGEVAGQLAWIDHLLGPLLDEHVPGLRQRIRHEVHARVLDPFASRRDWHWLGLDGNVNNWNPWIHQNVLTATLALVDDPTARSELVEQALDGLELYVAAIPDDGAIDEGFDYWWNGACRALEALHLVSSATRGHLDAGTIGSLRATINFPAAVRLGPDYCYSFADSNPRMSSRLPWHLLHRWSAQMGNGPARRFALTWRPCDGPIVTEDEGLGRLLLGLSDPDWAHSPPPELPAPADHYFDSTQVFLAHASRLALAAKGGHNDESHNHNDVGSVNVALDGVPVLVDPGRATYDAQTFGPRRYELWYTRSDWHSLPEIAGCHQQAGREYRAERVRVHDSADRAQFSAELTSAYPPGAASHWSRTACLDHSSTDRISITDRWSAQQPAAEPHRVRWIIAGAIGRHTDGHLEIRTMEGAGTIRLTWDPEVVTAEVETRALTDPHQRRSWGEELHRLTLTVRADHVATGELTTVLTPVRAQ